MKEYIIKRSGNCWIIDFGSNKLMQEMLDTTEFPLPFTQEAEGEMVRNFVQARFPDSVIVIG